MRKTLALCAVLVAGSPTWADVEDDIATIVEATVNEQVFGGALEAQRPLILGAVENQLRSQGIELANLDRFLDVLFEEFMAEFLETMQRESVSIYRSLFTEEELAGIAEFYRSEAGMALARKTPQLMAEGARIGTAAGQAAGINAGPRVMQRLESEGTQIIPDRSILEQIQRMFR